MKFAASLDPLCASLLAATDLHLITHVRGDADSATVYALALALQSLGKRVTVAHDLPSSLRWLIPVASFLEEPTESALVVALDTGNFARLALNPQERAKVADIIARHGREDAVSADAWRGVHCIDVVIDHHASNPGYGDLNWVDPESSSTAEMLVTLLRAMEDTTRRQLFTQAVVRSLFTGIVSDTQWFRRDTRAATYYAAAYLESRGHVDKLELSEQLETRSVTSFLLGTALRRNLKIEDDVVSSVIWKADVEVAGASNDDAAQLTEELERIPGKVYLLFLELSEHEIRVRLRGRGVVILPLAREFGGGGHDYRAGITLTDQSEIAVLRVAAQRLLASERGFAEAELRRGV